MKDIGVNSIDSLADKDKILDEDKILDSIEKIKKSSKSLGEELSKDLSPKKKSKENALDNAKKRLDGRQFDLTTAQQQYNNFQQAVIAARKELEKFQKIQQSSQTQTKKNSLKNTETEISKLAIEKANFKNDKNT